MKYRVSIDINKPRTEVSLGYVSLEHMFIWEKGLKRIDHHQGKLFNTGSMGYLIFEFDAVEMPMKVTVEKNDLPNEIIQIYEVPGAWNRCENHFIDQDSTTKWIMDVEFRFDQPVDLPVERFIEKTRASKQVFKDFMEREWNR